jgi:4-amino-4-deoxy-L-arabinose transferase-like glycosyltransferase
MIIAKMKCLLNGEVSRRQFIRMGKIIDFFRLTKGARLLLLSSFILMVAWSFVIPVFEAPDEPAHWRYARYVHHNHTLPYYSAADPEAHSPPLYYLLVAPFARHSEVPPRLTWRDSDGTVNLPSPPRIMQNSFSDFDKYWPIRITRLVTILISLVTILFCYNVSVEMTGRESTGLLAGSLAAFLPQFTFRGMNVSNDALVSAFGSITIYIIVRMVKRGTNWKVAFACSVAMAGAFLSKASAIFFPASFALAVMTDGIPWTKKLKLLCTLGISALLAAPWLIRNKMLYGEFFVRQTIIRAVPFLVDRKSLTSSYFLRPFPQVLTMSFVGVFGRMNVVMPDWIYRAFTVLAGIALAGYAFGLVRREISWRLTLILSSIVLLNFSVVIDFNLMFSQPQGRYMFPSLAAISALTALGLENLPYWSRTIWRSCVAALVLINVYILVTIVLPAYWPPVQMAVSTAVTDLTPTSLGELSRANEGNDLRVMGDDPQIVVDADFSTSPYNFLVFKIQAKPAHGSAAGAVLLRTYNHNSAFQTRIPFRWRSDGTEAKVIIPLYCHPEWRGHLRELRIKFFDPTDLSYIGSLLQVSKIELVGSFSDTSGP